MFKKLLSALLVSLVVFTAFSGVFANYGVVLADTFPYQQYTSQYASTTYRLDNGSTISLGDSACGIFSTVNAVQYLTKNYINPKELADWAYSNRSFNRYAGGTDASLYFKFLRASDYTAKYGFNVLADTVTWADGNSTALQQHVAKPNGAAIVMVEGHYIAVVDYNSQTQQYLVLDSAASTSRRGTTASPTWVDKSRTVSGTSFTYNGVAYMKFRAFALIESTVTPTTQSDNLALHKKYTTSDLLVTEEYNSNYPGPNWPDNGYLTNGMVSSPATYKETCPGMHNNIENWAIIDLGDEYQVGRVVCKMLAHVDASYGVPQTVKVYYSTDGTNYKEFGVGAYNREINKTAAAFYDNVTKSSPVTARYIKVTFADSINWIFCGEIEVYSETEEPVSTFEEEMRAKGFPESYIPYLSELHKNHPYWEFEAVDITGMNSTYTFDYVVSQEDVGSRNLVWYSTSSNSSYSPYYHSTDTTLYDSGWRRASNAAIRYFMDPRNFLNDVDIFMFETLEFNESLNSIDRINTALAGSFMANNAMCDNGITYAQHIYNCGKQYNVSAVALAARLKQEQGAGGSPLVEGTLGTTLYNYYINKPDYEGGKPVWGSYSRNDVFDTNTLLSYNGYYNFFNINASGTGKFAIFYNGAKEAKANGWDTKAKSIAGGSQKFATTFVGDHQDTVYFQKFNVDPRSSRNFWGQYMQNISGALTEGRTARNAYKSSGILERAFVFKIPVYAGMPATPAADPANGNSVLSPSVSTGSDFGSASYTASIKTKSASGKAEFKNLNSSTVKGGTKLYYTVTPNVGYKVTSITVNGKEIPVENEGKTYEYSLLMPAQDLNIVVEFVKLQNSNAVVGDINGDDTVSALDYMRLRMILIGLYDANDEEKAAADFDGNGNLNSLDYVKLRTFMMTKPE